MPEGPIIEAVRKELKEWVDTLMKTHNSIDVQNISPKIQGLSAYLASYDTQQLIELNRKLTNATKSLAIATFILAFATVILAIITYLKP